MPTIDIFKSSLYYHKQPLKNHNEMTKWVTDLYESSPTKEGNFYGTGFTTHFYNDFTSELNTLDLFKPLQDHILGHAHSYIADRIMYLAKMGSEINTSMNIKISKMWFNVNPTHGYQGRHHHAGFLLGGTYYLQVPEDSGRIEFTDPNPFSYYKNQEMAHRWLLNNYYAIEPEAGDLLIWPGYLDHEVKTNKSNDNRMTISFCIDWEESCPQ